MIQPDSANNIQSTPVEGSMSATRATHVSTSSSGAAVVLLSSSTTVDNGVAKIDMVFSTDMAKGAGYVYVTDGAVQTVIDRVTGQPTIRIVDATETLKIAVADLQVSGNHVIVNAAGLAANANYSVFMGEGALLSSALRPFAGVTKPGAVGFSVVDHASPVLTAMELSSNVLASGPGVELTIRFSEPVKTLPAGALLAPGATIGNLRPVGDGSVWKAALSTTSTVASSDNKVSLDMGQVRDAAGNAGSGSAYSPTYVIDDLRAPTATIAMPDTDLRIGESVEVTISFSEKVSGLNLSAFTASHVELSDLASTDGGQTWKLKVTADTPGRYASELQLAVNLAAVQDNAGNAGAGVIHSPVFSVDTRSDDAAPELESVVFDGYVLDAAHPLVATITFSEAVRADDLLAAFNADGANLSDLASSDGGKTWTLKLTAATTSTEPFIGEFDVNMGRVRDLSGNFGAGTETAAAYAVNGSGSMLFVYDNGVFDNDNVLGDVNRSVYGVMAGDFPNPAENFELSFNGIVVDNVAVTLLPHPGGLVWWYSGEEYWTEGVHDIVVKATRSDDFVVRIDKRITVDDSAPVLVESPASGATPPPFDVTGDLVLVFDEAVYFDDETPTITVVSVLNGVETTVDIELNASHLSTDRKTLTVAAADHHLAAGAAVTLSLPALTDVAGNWPASNEITFNTTGPDADTTIPTALRAIVNIDDHTARAGETIEFRIRFSESIRMLDDALPALGLSNGKKAQFSAISGNEMLFKYVVGVGDDTTDLSIVDTAELPEHVGDLAGNALDAAHIEFSGLYTSWGYGTHIDIDTVAPNALARPQLSLESNSGNNEDGLTKVRTPTLEGTGADAWAKIELYEGATVLGTGYADENGDWEVSVDLGAALADGVHNLSVKQLDNAGNRSAVSSSLSLTIDGSAAPALAAPRLGDGYDTGISAGDNITRENQPTLVGSGAEPGANIKLLFGDEVVGFGSADSEGNWSANLFLTLTEGNYTVTAQQYDAAGNTSPISAPLSFTVDRTGPSAAPPAPLLAASSDTGISDSDGITSDNTPTFLGTGALAHSEIVLYRNEIEVGRTVSDATGTWSITVGSALADGDHSIAVKQFDVAGNGSGYSESFDLEIDTVAPVSTGAVTNGMNRTYTLSFSEKIVFAPSGDVAMKQSGSTQAQFSASGSNWSKPNDTELSFHMASLQGLFHMQASTGALQDVAGNVAIVGTPHLEFTMPPAPV